MARNMQMKTTYDIAKTIQPIFTRGNVALTQDGRVLATCLDEDVVLSDLHTGKELARIEGVSFDFYTASVFLESLLSRAG
jgi:U3 small nucleolar RNA-associated protein 13